VPFAVLLAGVVGAGMCALLALNTATAASEVRERHVDAANSSLSAKQEQLSRALALTQAPAELARMAAKLGLVPAGSPAFLRLNADGTVTVLGAPAKVPTPPVPLTPAQRAAAKAAILKAAKDKAAAKAAAQAKAAAGATAAKTTTPATTTPATKTSATTTPAAKTSTTTTPKTGTPKATSPTTAPKPTTPPASPSKPSPSKAKATPVPTVTLPGGPR
jgi:hypothetical protein